jgi:hypothetical protein
MSAENPNKPGWGHTEKETMTQPQEEFIQQESTPSRDMSQVSCDWCGKPRKEWTGTGVIEGEKVYCCIECSQASNRV